MQADIYERADEAEDLQACLKDLLSVLALPTAAAGGEPSQLLGALLEALVAMLRLDFAYAALSGSSDGALLEQVRLARFGNAPAQPRQIGRVLKPWLRADSHNAPWMVPSPTGEGEVSIAPWPLGCHGETGWLVAGSRRANFPTAAERILLSVAANQAAIALQEARLLGQQRRVGEELERWVARRTRELQAAQEARRNEVQERKRAEDKLRRTEACLTEAETLGRLGTWAYDVGRRIPSYWSAAQCRLSGFDPARGTPSLEQERATHPPEDWSKLRETVDRAIRQKAGFQTGSRLVFPDGSTKHLRISGRPILNDSGDAVELVGATLDVTAAKQAEDALNHARAELEAERDRLRLLLELSKALVAHHDLRSLFKALADSLRRVMECDFIGLALPDPAGGLRQHLVDYDEGRGALTEGTPVPLRGCASGRAFRTRQLVRLGGCRGKEIHTVIYGTPEGEKFYPRLPKEGVPSGYFLPLIHDGEVIGVTQLTKYAAVPVKTQTPEFLNALAGGLAVAVANALKHHAPLASRDQFARTRICLRKERCRASVFEEIVGTSPALQTVLSRVTKVAANDSTVLITGETGTGKELIARAIHKRSARAARAFVSVNCAAIPSSLIASELFGHEKGAFTGAIQRRLGRFELARGGTIFLDEVGELPAETQIALLRVLQENQFERVGGTQPIQADTRLIAATNRDLEAAIAAGKFRSDLFYRLNVFPIEVPPLRARKEDILLLANHFVHRYAATMGKKISGISKETLAKFQSYSWPGNIRELQNVVQRSLTLCETDTFSVDESWLARQPRDPPTPAPPFSERLVTVEKAMIEAALAETRGRVSGPSGAAVRLGIPASTLESKIRVLKINKHRFKTQ